MGCASSHGIGPSIAILDTVRDGRLDYVCVYPSPLHSRGQMQEFIDNMKSVLVEGCNSIYKLIKYLNKLQKGHVSLGHIRAVENP